MSQAPKLAEKPEFIAPGHTLSTVSDKITKIVLTRETPRGWYVGFGIAFVLLMVLLASITMLLVKGIGVWGINVPVGWGLAIINFVWWIGIGHAGTLISAILLLFRQDWRTSINRFAEAMTLFAVACAGGYLRRRALRRRGGHRKVSIPAAQRDAVNAAAASSGETPRYARAPIPSAARFR